MNRNQYREMERHIYRDTDIQRDRYTERQI
jgi:hypothetical protein